MYPDGGLPQASIEEGGFTLVEALVSLAILGMMLGVLVDVFATSSWRSRQAEQLAQAGLAAQSLLARVGSDLSLRPGFQSGEREDGTSWELRIDVLPEESGGDWSVVAYKVTAGVSWMENTRKRAVTLTTVRLGPKEAQP